MIVGKIGRRGQVTVPSRLRKQLDLREGDRIAIVRRGEDLLLHPLKKTLLDLRGSVPVSGPQDFATIRKKVLTSHVEGHAQPAD